MPKPLGDEDRRTEYLINPSYHETINAVDFCFRRALDEETLHILTADLALYGKAYAEITHTDEGDMVLKPLDPRYIEERRTEGVLIGYVQTGPFPPVTLSPSQILALRCE